MNADYSTIQAYQKTSDVLFWLRKHVPANAKLHADTRSIKSGDVFFAYPVDGSDSRIFIQDAVMRGASGILYQPDGFKIEHKTLPMLAVPKLNSISGNIASAWYGYPSNILLVIGVTGTNGKTSCTQWISSALTSIRYPCAVIGTLGNGMAGGDLLPTGFTMPDALQLQLSLAKLYKEKGARAVAIEVSSHGLHQGRANGTLFDIAVFTNLSVDHLDYHNNINKYEETKAKLFEFPGLRTAIINQADSAGVRLLKKLTGRVRTIAYGIGDFPDNGANCTLIADNVSLTETGSSFRIRSSLGEAHLSVSILGRFNISNILAVLGVLLSADVPFNTAIEEIIHLQPIIGRMQKFGGRIHKDEPIVVIDYAHTPDALEKALEMLRLISVSRGGKLICIFGCGGNRDATKRPLMGSIAERLADYVIVTSDNPRNEDAYKIINQIVSGMKRHDFVSKIKCRANAISQTILMVSKFDVVLVAGKGHEITQEIMGKKYPFSDQDQVQKALLLRTMRKVRKMNS